MAYRRPIPQGSSMAYRPPARPRGGPPPTGPRAESRPAPSPAPDSSAGYGVPYYQNGRDVKRREYYDTYAFSNPESHNQWASNGQPSRPTPPSSMPRPRQQIYRPYPNPPPQQSYSSLPAGPGYPQYQAPNASYPSRSVRPFSTNATASGSGASSYIAPHKRQQGQSPSMLNTSRPPSQPPQDYRSDPSPPFVIPIPDAEYLKLSEPYIPSNEDRSRSEPPNKLLVLDLNGTLIYRNKNTGNSRSSYPRPYLANFLEYLLRVEGEGSQTKSGKWSVFVWSSAQPHNVRGMLESTFDPNHIEGLWDQGRPNPYAKGRILGVWARDKMGLSAQQYGKCYPAP